MTERWVRSQRAAVVEVGHKVVLANRDGVLHTLDGKSGELARVVLAYLSRPRTEAEVIARVEELAGPLGDRREVVRQLLMLLAETSAITREELAPHATGVNIVVCVSGAIAASHAPAFVSALLRRGHTVEVALTATARRFVGVDALAAIAQREVHTETWPRAAHAPVPHVALAAWADLVIVYPASATTIGRIANGDFSELGAAIVLTTRAPVVIVPSMNEAMLSSPAVQRNLEMLRADGHAIVHGVPSHEIAEAPSRRDTLGGAAPAPSEVAQLVELLRAGNVLGHESRARTWDAAYRAPLVPWASPTCDPDLATALATYAPAPCRVLDIGCGLGQVARHAVAAGHHVVATDVSDVALALARTTNDAIVWLRDDICATALAGTFDVVIDRATLHALAPERLAAWSIAIRRLAAERAIVLVKAHRDGIAGVTTGWSAAKLAALLPGFEVIAEASAELPGIADPTPVASILVALRRVL